MSYETPAKFSVTSRSRRGPGSVISALKDVVVELYHGPTMASHELAAGSIARMRVASSNPDGTHTFLGGIPTLESGSHAFAARVMPWNASMSHPYETSLVRWA